MTNTGTPSTPLAGKVICHALWADDGRRLADFYAAALGTEVSETFPDEHGTDVAHAFHVGAAMYLFFTSEDFTAPNWPEDPLPFHMDLAFDDARAAVERLLELGATKPAFQPGGAYWTVLLDPSGQPFCVHGAR
ncbi:VOC family protein [Streptomyces sp. AN091965]|uniref:VOC family protein n=1 Tax=Streptomyces sp. AN091965 TaxID=2927803 RepID=UPI001F603833|nr:VOC family protein [Streptomyces sp. AN091965]MCI3928510.1 VOC family protein [Streptomyces sp. AN091965]